MHQRTDQLWPRGSQPAQALCGEDDRLSVLAAHHTDALVGDEELARIASLAAKICETPIALVSIVERDRQHFLARLGIDASETPRPTSFCAHAMLGSQAMVVPDATKDERFKDNPLVTAEPNIRFYAGYPLVSLEGAPLGSLCVIDTQPREHGLTELQHETLEVLGRAVMRRLESRRQLSKAEEADERLQKRVRQILDSVPGIAWSADADLNFDYFNAQWREVTGLDQPASVEEWSAAVHPEDFGPSRDEFVAAVTRGATYEAALRIRHASGEWRWMLSRVVPVQTPEGEHRWVGTLTDIHEEHSQREAKELLAGELSHRIKNIFAVISGLIAIRSRGKPELAEFTKELGAAIRALGTAHDYVRPDDGRSSDNLQGLLQDLLKPYDDGRAARLQISGDDVETGPRAATPLALIFHELATNSAKYGALSCDDGEIRIAISADAAPDGDIRVTWTEVMRGYCDTLDSEYEGFGSRLLRMAVENQLEGRFDRSFGEEGIVIDLAFPKTKILP